MRSIPDQMLRNLVTATEEVFEAMVVRKIDLQPPIQGAILRPPRSNVLGTVSFAGSHTGIVAFYSMLGTANVIASTMLGITPDQVDDEMPDAIGEITNMIAGSFRSKMAETCPPWVLSVPMVVTGADLCAKYVSNVRRALCPFMMDDDEIFVELVLLREERS